MSSHLDVFNQSNFTTLPRFHQLLIFRDALLQQLRLVSESVTRWQLGCANHRRLIARSTIFASNYLHDVMCYVDEDNKFAE